MGDDWDNAAETEANGWEANDSEMRGSPPPQDEQPMRRQRSRSFSPRKESAHEENTDRRHPPRRPGGLGGPGGRDNGETPSPTNVLGVFGLSLRTVEADLNDIFGAYGPLEKVTIVYDNRSQRSRGFGFIYFKVLEDATTARNKLNGLELHGRVIRVDYSKTERPHTPTPGEYMGTRGDDRYSGRFRRHSPRFNRYGDRERFDHYEPRRERYGEDRYDRDRGRRDHREKDRDRDRHDRFEDRGDRGERDRYEERGDRGERERYEERGDRVERDRYEERSRSHRRSVSPRDR